MALITDRQHELSESVSLDHVVRHFAASLISLSNALSFVDSSSTLLWGMNECQRNPIIARNRPASSPLALLSDRPVELSESVSLDHLARHPAVSYISLSNVPSAVDSSVSLFRRSRFLHSQPSR